MDKAGKSQVTYGKIQPQDTELEEIVIGATMVDQGGMQTVLSILDTDSFYSQKNQIVFEAVKHLYKENDQIDIMTVVNRLRSTGKLEEAGGAIYVSRLTDRVISSANIEVHCRIIQQKYILRLIIERTTRLTEEAYEAGADPFDCLRSLEYTSTKINEIIASGGRLRSISQVVDDVEREANNRHQLFLSGQSTGVPTGLKELDAKTNGWQPGELIVLAGRPSMGKTALMLHHALNANRSVCIYSLEMSDVSLVNRMILTVSHLDSGRFMSGNFDADDWTKFNEGKRKLSEKSIYIDDNPNVSTNYIKAHSKMMKDKGQCDVIFIDYLQLADMRSDKTGRNREQEVAQCTREMKIIAKTLNVPVILLSQLSRSCESRTDKKPLLSDLRESGAIEQDADIVMFAYRPAYYGITDVQGNKLEGLGYILIAKGRNIGTGEVMFGHDTSMTRIWDMKPDQVQSVKDPF